MLFSTPDIIRRVGGKEPTTPTTPTDQAARPAKIGKLEKRLSLGGGQAKAPGLARSSIDGKVKGRRQSEDVGKSGRRDSLEVKKGGEGKSYDKGAVNATGHVTVHGLDESRGNFLSVCLSSAFKIVCALN